MKTTSLFVLCLLFGLIKTLDMSRHTIKKIRKARLNKDSSNNKQSSKVARGGETKVNREIFINTWAVRVVGDDTMAQKVANDYGFVYKGKVFGDVYEFIHRGVPKRRKRASFIKTLRLEKDNRVRWTQQQATRIRVKRSTHDMYFNDEQWANQWYIHRREANFEGQDMNILPVWKRGITGKGVVISILDDGLEHTHPELKANYDPKASYDYNNNDTDPMPVYSWRGENQHGTRCAGEVAAAANNSKCIVGVAYGAKIGGIRMLDGEITDLVEAQSLRHARDHIDIYSSSWGPEDDGKTVDGPGPLTMQALTSGAKYGRKGKGSIFVWASGNGGRWKDYCNCDGYTNSIYTISVSTATSVGAKPWYLEHCASTLVSTYTSGINREKQIVTSDLNGKCTDSHTGTSVAPPLVAGIIALALEINPSLTWRDVQHLLVETSSLKYLKGEDFNKNGAGKKFSHSFGFGMVNGEKMVNLAENWPTLSEQHVCMNEKEIKLTFPHNRFNITTPLLLEINSTGCQGTSHFIRYVEHVQVYTTLFHYRRGATEISIQSPMGTVSWVLKERTNDKDGGQFKRWKFLSTHFWGENPAGKWTISFISKDPSMYGQGYLRNMKLMIYGTEHKPGEKPNSGSAENEAVVCHKQCLLTCTGPDASQCDNCKGKYFVGNSGEKVCVEVCPLKMYLKDGSSECIACHDTCLECAGHNATDCLSCPPNTALLNGMCVPRCPTEMFKLQDVHNLELYHCQHCNKRCTHCRGTAQNCSACYKGSTLHGNRCLASCGDDEWLDRLKCQKCHSSCKTCGGGSQYNCTSCTKKALTDTHDRFLYKSSQCVESCPIGTYIGDSVNQPCLDCPENCLTCTNNGRKCGICDVSYFYVAVDGKCVKECGDGYYVDYIRRVCEPCDSQCKSCVPGNPKACTSCQENFFLKDQNCISIEECRTTVYVNQTTGTCDVCPVPCKFCDSREYCTGCWLSYYLTPEKTCVDECPSGYYPQANMQCQKCAGDCSECNGPFNTDCTSCSSNKYLHGGKCIEQVPRGHYAKHNVCYKCHHKCEECNGPSEKECITCIGNLDMRESGCMHPCPTQWLSKNDCQNCHPSCNSCYGPLETDCLQCSGNYSLNVNTKRCNKACPRKFYQDAKSLTCRPCHQSCGTCFGPNDDQCKSCSTKLNFFNNTCVLQCPSGWYSTFGSMCAKCSPRCKKCLYKYDLCTDCHSELVWNNFKCFDQCLPKHFHDPVNHRCYPCHESCNTCNGTAPNQCLSCPEGMSLRNGMCLYGCLIGHYNSSSSNKCLPCMENCLQCRDDDVGNPRCTVCTNTTLLVPDGTCQNKCPLSTYRMETNNVCLKCPGKNCVDCLKDKGKKCTICEPLYQLSNGLCKSTCAKGTYPDIEKRVCVKCHSLCTTCDGPTKHNCLECKRKALTLLKHDKTISCVLDCPQGFFKQENFCYTCESGCESCTNSDDCTKCVAPLVLYDKNCQSQCPTSFYNNSTTNKCQSCQIYGKCLECNETRCLQCTNDTYLQNGMECVSDCGSGHYSTNNTCISCQDAYANCSECNASNCSECLPGFLNKDGVCNIIWTEANSVTVELPISTFTTTTLPETKSSKPTFLSTALLSSNVNAELIGEDTEEAIVRESQNILKTGLRDLHTIVNNDDIDQTGEDDGSSEEIIQALSGKLLSRKSLYQLEEGQMEGDKNLSEVASKLKNKVIIIKSGTQEIQDHETTPKLPDNKNNETAKPVTIEADNKPKLRAKRSMEDSLVASGPSRSSSGLSHEMCVTLCVVIAAVICGVVLSN